MKFCDKLAKIRKNNNLSQEQLADRLGVSRQAVSKWESGLSHPDMDKIIQMCKILDCTLEELMDDDIIGGKFSQEKKKNTIGTYFNDFLSFLTKISNMFSSMRFKEKIKCILEMIFIGIILLVMGTTILLVLEPITYSILTIIPYNIQYKLTNLLTQIYILGLIMLGVIIFIHLFKVRYLDYYITIEDKYAKEKIIEKPLDKKETVNEKETIIIRDPKHSTFSFLNLLEKIISIFGKILCTLILMPILLLFTLIIIGSTVIFYHIVYGNIFLCLSLICIGLIILSFIIIKVLVNILFNTRINLKIIFIVFISSLILIGIGSGLTIVCFTKYKNVHNYDDLKKNILIEEIEIKDNMSIYTPGKIEYVIDNNLENAKIEITTIEAVSYRTQINNDAYNNFYHIYITDIDYSKLYELVMNDLKNKVIRRYNSDSDLIKVKVYISEKNYNKLDNFYNNYYY